MYTHTHALHTWNSQHTHNGLYWVNIVGFVIYHGKERRMVKGWGKLKNVLRISWWAHSSFNIILIKIYKIAK